MHEYNNVKATSSLNLREIVAKIEKNYITQTMSIEIDPRQKI